MKNLAVVVCLALLAAAGRSVAPAAAADPLVIYAIVPLTGPIAFVGKTYAQTLHAAELLTDRTGGIGGRPIHFEIEDDQSSPATTVQLANQLLAKHVPVIVGPSFAGACAAVAPIVKDGPATFCFSPAFNPASGSYMFSGGVSALNLAITSLRFMRNHGWHRVALLDSTDATGRDSEQSTLIAMQLPENRDMQLVAVEHFNISDISVSAQIARIKAAGAEAMLEWAAGTPFGTILHGLSDAGYDIPLVCTAANSNYDTLQQFGTLLPKRTYFQTFLSSTPSVLGPGPVKNAQKTYYAALAAVGAQPDSASGTAWDTISVMLDALRHLGPDANAQAIRDYVLQLHGFPGVNGLLDYRDGTQRGSSVQSAIIVRWDPATRQWIPASGRGGSKLPGERS